MRRWLPALVLPLLFATASADAALSPQEKSMATTVDAEYERTVSLLQKLVDQNSGTMNLAGVRKVADMVRPEFEQLGFRVEWKPMDRAKRAGHLIATHAGKGGGKRLLLIGHLDTVFEADSPFQKFERDGNRGHGPGAGDDKGGVVVMLAALRAMRAAGTLKDANIEVVLTGDEEDAGSPHTVSRADLIAAGKRADVALDFEGLSVEGGQDMGSIARRSVADWTLTTRGRSGHSSRIFSEAFGDGAVFEMARIIAAFRKELPEPNLTFNVGLIGGGQAADLAADGSHITAAGKSNIVPSVAVAKGDFRTLSPEQSERVVAKMKRIVAAHLPGTEAELAFEEGYPPMAPTAGNRALLARLNEINADLGLAKMPELDPLLRGAGDISFVAADVDGLVGLGPSSSGDHTPKETVDLDSLRRQAKRAAILMSRLGASP
ncbi:MAG TPA: M20/M25/M40 family metallo-hydrolase [Pseudoxanthomonas sp.]|nr:M20/M25/M40 family metallo-hydrolase [Pseudoxanthomonas sp.]